VAVLRPGGPGAWGGLAGEASRLREVFGDDRLSIALARWYDGHDGARERAVVGAGARAGVAVVATNPVRYHDARRRPLHDVLACIRLGTTLGEAGYTLAGNGEGHLKPPEEMSRLFAGHPRALARTVEIASRTAGFSLEQLRYQYPREVSPAGVTPMAHLRMLTVRGAGERYPAGVPAAVRAAIEHELALIEELDYPSYFLTVHELVEFARSRGILCQGRGAAANSAVCYVLGITSVDPARASLLFERFISRERREPPDIDLDIEHERREEVIQHLYARFGRERAALTAEVISYRGRSAVREVGKALGLSLDLVDRLAKSLEWWDGEVNAARLRELGLDPADRTLRLVLELCAQVRGFPRHRSQHVGGFVITDSPLCELVPIENAAMEGRTIIEWDKDDIDAMGMMKVDCLGLGMLTCIRKCLGLVNARTERAGGEPLRLHTVPPEDPAVYDMICRADTLGVFQIESRAQMAMLPRLRPRCFYDLVIEVAIVRPGPIQGKMVHPYLRRRNGEEPVTFPSADVEAVLGRTLGVPLFQEQAMKLAMVAGGFSAGEADQLRRAMAAWKRKGDAIARFGEKLVAGMLARGYPREFAERCYEQIKGFSEYGFPESHAASFALLVYVSCWLKHHHPGAFAAALINSQPMGFYQPAQIVRDARDHGVEVRPIDVSFSAWDCTLEGPALRLGMRLVAGLSPACAEKIVDARAAGVFGGLGDVARRAGLSAGSLRRLARADAFRSLGLDRPRALWGVQGLKDERLPLFDGEPVDDARGGERLPARGVAAAMTHDLLATGLSLRAHPIGLRREELARVGVARASDLGDATAYPHGRRVAVAGVVLVRQRPATASGVLFMTIEDETGFANLVVWPRTYERLRRVLRHSGAIVARGRVERSGQVVHVVVDGARSLRGPDAEAASVSRDFH
jgi:error-prone DNA polymerase